MSPFASRSIRLSGELILAGPVEEVFELFSPLGENHWVPEWRPELLHPPGATWETGLIFRTHDEHGEAVWVVTWLDRFAHVVEYHRVEPGRYVVRIEIRCAMKDPQTTKTSTIYEFIGLSNAGNAEIAAMTQESYHKKMANWTSWINGYLARRVSHP